MDPEPIPAGRAGNIPRVYGGDHVAFVLGLGLFVTCLFVGLRYAWIEGAALPGIGLNPYDQAERQMARGDRGPALRQYRMAASISPWDPNAALRLARAVGPTMGSSEAEAWRALLALDGRNVEAHLMLGQWLVRAGRLPEATVHFLQAQALAPERLDVALSLGDALMDQGQAVAARRAYGTALPLHTTSAVLHNSLGMAWAHEGRFDDAIAEFTMAATQSSDRSIADNLAQARVDRASGSGGL